MLRSHRNVHRLVWIVLAILLPVICGYALWFRAPANSSSLESPSISQTEGHR